VQATDNAIIPEKERAVDAFSDSLRALLRGGPGRGSGD
jgi:hypothetical protein